MARSRFLAVGRRRVSAPVVAATVAAASVLAVACGHAKPAYSSAPDAAAALPTAPAQAAAPPAGTAATPALADWPQFGLDAQRTGASSAATGITAGNVRRLKRLTIQLPGTVDSSPIYLHAVGVGGSTHDVIVVTTTYGKTLALDAHSGRTLWTFTPSSYDSYKGSTQITNTTPLADPDRRSLYTASPDGRIHKLSLAEGREAGGSWPAAVTRDPSREKLAAALNIDGPYVVAATGGYLGDAPPYQGHVVLIDRNSGAIADVFNTLCADRRGLLRPSSCPSSDSAIWARAGAVVEPGGRLLVATGNGPYNGSTDFGDSVLELNFPHLALRQAFTPSNQDSLRSSDTDLGSSAPTLLSSGLVMIGGKDGVLRVLRLGALNGHPPSARHVTGGEVQTLKTPGGDQLLTQPAVWRRGGRTAVFVADGSGTAALVVKGGRVTQVWSNSNPGTSPVLAGGLLYVYNPSSGGVNVYRPGSPRPITTLPCGSGHWNSPVVANGQVVAPEGDANNHSLSGTLTVFSLR